jgi:hypothetical protein
VKADIKKEQKKILEVCAVAWERKERENGRFLQLIEEDQVFKILDCVSVYEMKQYTFFFCTRNEMKQYTINMFSYNNVK